MSLNHARLVLALSVAANCIGPCFVVKAQSPAEIYMVVSGANKAPALTVAQARKILLGETRAWPGGGSIVVLLPGRSNPAREDVLKKICGMSDSAFQKQQAQASFTGGSPTNLREAAVEAAVRGILNSDPSTVGFVHSGNLDSSVRVLLELK